ncbi:MAG: hypothetical protein GEU91_05535 [Rhizobiales bacterium]|nr:hypothetical protein [Hyphomicrobiales bacterium]
MNQNSPIPHFIELDKSDIQEAEKIPAFDLESALLELDGYIKKFECALQIFDYSRGRKEELLKDIEYDMSDFFNMMGWERVAARDGAMTIWHFAKCLAGIRSRLNEVPTINAKVNHTELRTAAKLFESKFKDFEDVRNAVAHIAELHKNSQASDFNSIHAAGGSHRMSENFHGRTFASSFEGKLVHYTVSQETLNDLIAIKDRAFDAFSGATRT